MTHSAKPKRFLTDWLLMAAYANCNDVKLVALDCCCLFNAFEWLELMLVLFSVQTTNWMELLVARIAIQLARLRNRKQAASFVSNTRQAQHMKWCCCCWLLLFQRRLSVFECCNSSRHLNLAPQEPSFSFAFSLQIHYHYFWCARKPPKERYLDTSEKRCIKSKIIITTFSPPPSACLCKFVAHSSSSATHERLANKKQ